MMMWETSKRIPKEKNSKETQCLKPLFGEDKKSNKKVTPKCDAHNS